MPQTSVNLYARKWAVTSSSRPNDVQELHENFTPLYQTRRLYVGFDSLPVSVPKRAKLISVDATFSGSGTYQQAYYVYLNPSAADFDPETLVWNNQPAAASGNSLNSYFVYGDRDDKSFVLSASSAASQSKAAKQYITTCAAFFKQNNTSSPNIYYKLSDNSSLPYIRIFYDPDDLISSQIVYRSGPKSGYSNPRQATSFGWGYETDDTGDYAYIDETFTQASATFYWKESTSESYTAVSVSGTATSVTIAANTFPAGKTIQWYVSGTDTDGTTTTTDVYSFSTSAGSAIATAQSPINTVEDGSGPITFRWTLGSTDGQTPSGVDFWWKLPSEGNNEWHAILSNASPRTSYTVPAGTFPAGEIQWIVRGYNIDGTAGPWSRPSSGYYSFICVAAPDPVEGLNATAVPFTTVSWQSDAQQAYEIAIDGETVYRAFGTDVYSWTADEPLEDGEHTVSVRVQGQYGFWSQPSTVTITISNTAPNSITLDGSFDLDANLFWSFGSTPADSSVRIYRDGIRIGRTNLLVFYDRRVLGEHSYYVLLPDNSGNYTKSNTVTGAMSTRFLQVAPLDGSSGWLTLRLSENSADEHDFQWSRTQIVQHVTGAKYPEAELSQFEDLSASYNVAFRDPTERAAFEALRGKAVILKSRGDNVVIGILNQISKRQTVFYTAYAFTVTQIHDADRTEVI